MSAPMCAISGRSPWTSLCHRNSNGDADMPDAPEDGLGLPPGAFARIDDTDDELFYEPARLVLHIDDGAVAALTELYRSVLPSGGALLDVMSSWVSHLPPEIGYPEI